MYMPSDAIEIKVTGFVGTIVLNRPEFGNALTRSMIRQLAEAVDDLYLERRVRAIVLVGAGTDFCRGLDLNEMQASAEMPDHQTQWGIDAAEFCALLVRMMEITKPIIAAVHGAVHAGGVALVAASDLVVAADRSELCLPETRQGLVAGFAAPLLNFRVGVGTTARLMLTGAPVSAAEALRLGLFHELVPPDLVWARAVEWAEQCAAGAPQAIQLTKRLINETLGESIASQLSCGAAMAATARTTEAAAEGIVAYLEKRSPKWDG